MSKIIFTDDDWASMRQIVQLSLVRAGFGVVEAHDGKDALVRLQQQRVDMVITDRDMPNLDRLGLIRAMEGCKFVPIVMLTTESHPDRKQAGKAAGARGWITKPFVPEEFVSVVHRLLGRP